MALRFQNKTAVVTGAASGIGRATAKRLSDEGAQVVLADLNYDRAKQALSQMSDRCWAFQLDVSQEENWQELCRQLKQRNGLDILVNCAGIGITGDFEDMALQDWQAMMDVNLTAVFLGCKHAIKLMKCNESDSSIINISSVGGLVGGEDIAAYCASKGGVTLLSKSLALYCAGKGYSIRCNSVHPSYVDTEMLDPIASTLGGREIMLEAMASLVPMGRVAKPEDVAASIAYLASSDAAFVNGHQMLVDGAQLAGIPARHSA